MIPLRILYRGEEIVSLVIHEDQIEITIRRRTNMMYATNPPKPAPDEVWRETYRIVDGKLAKTNQITGRHEPAKVLNEKFVFPGDDE